MVKAYVLVATTSGGEYEVFEDLLKVEEPGVRVRADVVYGIYDIVVMVEAPDLAALDRVVTRIRKHPKVTKTVTLISSTAR